MGAVRKESWPADSRKLKPWRGEVAEQGRVTPLPGDLAERLKARKPGTLIQPAGRVKGFFLHRSPGCFSPSSVPVEQEEERGIATLPGCSAQVLS
jgi:hypothetical protein